MDNLNEFLQPVGAPVASNQQIANAFDFSWQNERNAISQTKFPYFSFSKGQGGTLTLGGSGNGNGNLLIENSSGSVIVKGDNTGLAVYNGSITIQNTSGSSSLDSMGVVSNSNNFKALNNNSSPSQSISGTTFTTVNNSSGTLILARTTTVLFLLTTEAYLVESLGNTADAELGLNIDGAVPFCATFLNSGNNYSSTRTSFYLASLGAGTHTINVQAKLTTIHAGTPSLTVASFSWCNLNLGI